MIGSNLRKSKDFVTN